MNNFLDELEGETVTLPGSERLMDEGEATTLPEREQPIEELDLMSAVRKKKKTKK